MVDALAVFAYQKAAVYTAQDSSQGYCGIVHNSQLYHPPSPWWKRTEV